MGVWNLFLFINNFSGELIYGKDSEVRSIFQIMHRVKHVFLNPLRTDLTLNSQNPCPDLFLLNFDGPFQQTIYHKELY